MGEDDESSADRPGSHDGSTFDGILQEIARAPFREPPPTAQVADPEQIAHFRIEGRLGQGAMGIVFRARDTSLHRTVALKVLPGGFERDETRRARFLREARAAAALNHPNLAAVYEVGQADGRIYIAMEHVPLRQLLAERRPSVDESLRIARQIAAALAHAHTAGVIHRDLKPDNVMIGSNGVVKVLDFGLAKVQQSGQGSNLDTETEAGQVMGTPAYMAPEQFRGSQVTAAADVFAFGVILYEMLTGERPFGGEGRLGLAHAIASETPSAASSSNDGVPADVDALVAACLVKAGGERLADGAALERRLVQVMRELPGSRTTTPSTAPALLRRFGGLLFVTGLALAAAVLGAWLEAAKAPATGSGASSIAPTDAALAQPPSARAGVVTMINSPPPASVSAEALRHYQEGLADLRRCAMSVGRDQLAQAVALDPTFAAARLRLGIWDTSPAELRDVARVRESLDARDQALLHATEPMVFEVPPNIPEVIRRLTALAAAAPNDTEVLFYEGMLQLETDAPLALATLAHVLELDPGMACAEDEMGWAALKNDQPQEAVEHFRRCVELSPGATSCFRHLAREEGRLGDCQAFTETARRGLVVEPEDYTSQLMWLSARLAGGAPEAEALALVDDAVSSASARHIEGEQLGWFVARRAVASWYGDFDAALRLGYEAVDAGRVTDESDLAARVAAMEELGREAEALAPVRLYISKRASGGDGFDGVALRVLREHGDEAEMKRLRDEWLRAPRQSRRFYRKDVSPERDTADWLTYYGTPTLSVADAREAMAAKERFAAIPIDGLDPDEKEELGRIYLLAGSPAEAIAPLTQAAATCEPFEYNRMVSFIAPMVRARYELGLANEALGDSAAACAAYASVLERWGAAKPKSRTADLTRARMKALACPPAPP